MLIISLLAFVAGLACCCFGAVSINRRSAQWDAENPVEKFVTKTYVPATRGGLDGSAFIIGGGFVLLCVALVCYLAA